MPSGMITGSTCTWRSSRYHSWTSFALSVFFAALLAARSSASSRPRCSSTLAPASRPPSFATGCRQAGCGRVTPAPKREEQRSQGQERYPAHGLWPGLARPRARIPTASGRGSRQGCSRLKAGVSDKKQSKHISNYFELIFFMKRIFK